MIFVYIWLFIQLFQDLEKRSGGVTVIYTVCSLDSEIPELEYHIALADTQPGNSTFKDLCKGDLMEETIAQFELKEKVKEMEKRLARLEKRNRIRVRVVNTAKGKRIILEQAIQSWFSPEYFEKVLKGTRE